MIERALEPIVGWQCVRFGLLAAGFHGTLAEPWKPTGEQVA